MQKLLSSKTVFKAPLFDVQEDRVSTSTDTYEFFSAHSHPAVGIIPITPKGEIYLINQYRYFFGQQVLGIIAGHIDNNETPLKAAKRELEEEGGITASQWELLVKTEISRSVLQQTFYLFIARDLEMTQQKLMAEEEIDVVKISLKDAVAKVMSGEIYHSPSMTGILMLDKLRQEKRL